MIPIVISVSEDNDIQEVEEKARRIGMEIRCAFPILGMILGQAEPYMLHAIKNLQGVDSVDDNGHLTALPTKR